MRKKKELQSDKSSTSKVTPEEGQKSVKKVAQEGAKGEGVISRRSFLGSIGLSALILGFLGQAWIYLRALIPNVLYEKDKRYKIGKPEAFSEGGVFLPEQKIFVFREANTFYCISGVCTHLGCTVQMISLDKPKTVKVRGKELTEAWEFHCPCHGSKFYGDGTNYAGPAPKPLPYFALEVAPDDGQLIVDAKKPVDKGWRLTV